MELVILMVVFLGAIVASLDMALAMILGSAALLLYTGTVPIHLIAEKSVSQVSLYPLLAIPGFIVAGELMNVTGLTRALGELARILVGRWRGGMGHATVIACMIFGGMTGSGLAETVAIGSLMVPLLYRHGYPKSFSSAIVAAGGSLGPIIPPSIPMVIYAFLGSSRVLSVSSTTTLGILTGAELAIVVPDGDPMKLVIATATLTALVGRAERLPGVVRERGGCAHGHIGRVEIYQIARLDTLDQVAKVADTQIDRL